MAELLLIACLLCPLYVYVGYPALLALLGTVFSRPVHKGDATPFVSMIIAAHNEAATIADKISNTLELDYPDDALEIIVAADGCSDETVRIAEAFAANEVRVLDLPRCGKVAALNAAVEQSRGTLLVFTDANAMLARNALRALVAPFCDRHVGGVCGNQEHLTTESPSAAERGETSYWSYDAWLKTLESRLGSAVGADGSLYAIRRTLLVPLDEPAQAEDLAISARVVTQGWRLIFEPSAVAFEAAPQACWPEFRRKVRVANHTVRAIENLVRRTDVLRRPGYLFVLASHKILRYAVPFVLPLALAASIVAAKNSVLCALALGAQVLFYAAAAAGGVVRRRASLFHAPFYFCLANAAVLVGVMSAARGHRIATWQPQRDGDLPPREARP